ncbi:zinc finger domain-containing protein [Nocardia sp. Marseille-Q1738]
MGAAVTATVYRLDDYRPTLPRLLSRTVSCPICLSPIGAPCVVRGTRQRRPEGPHALRIELAEDERIHGA